MSLRAPPPILVLRMSSSPPSPLYLSDHPIFSLGPGEGKRRNKGRAELSEKNLSSAETGVKQTGRNKFLRRRLCESGSSGAGPSLPRHSVPPGPQTACWTVGFRSASGTSRTRDQCWRSCVVEGTVASARKPVRRCRLCMAGRRCRKPRRPIRPGLPRRFENRRSGGSRESRTSSLPA